ncbi:MAG: hydrogenase iron-sulfur subunit [Acidobacteriota bacterium]|jgi:coenzyme F420-reducing hydrogenase delta subunit/formate hydrogenlyase subunit 6/NADH:ubiquinone oxidoreductase subunit I|nr:hydrogenase iron-sulfur subunit [Acidobacteriota bacterium]
MNLEKLEKWKTALNKCIRCGYCYEHCQIYKSTRWESDSPRGKLILLYGLLSGQVAPSPYVASKLFECFHCNRCQKACSSGVPIQDVYNDARAFLKEAGYDVPGTTSQTDYTACARCMTCVRMCKHEARTCVNGRVVIDRLKCQSCGNCLDVCPVQGIDIGHGYGTNPDEMKRDIEEFFENPANTNAKAIVFSCGWSNYPGLQTSRYDKFDENPEYKVLVTVCGGRVMSETVLDALNAGARGVLIACCPEDDCEHGGSARIKARMGRLVEMLESMGIDPKRVKVEDVPPKDAKKFSTTVKGFMDEVKALGPILAESAK